MVGGLLAREVAAEFARRRQAVSFPMLVASGFAGFVVWHMGYSGSGPLTAATPGSFIEKQVGHVIPIGETIFSWWNLSAIVVTLILVALALWLVAPRSVPESHTEQEIARPVIEAPADRLDASRIPTTLVGLALVAYLIIHFAGGGTVTLNIVNWMFLGLIFL